MKQPSHGPTVKSTFLEGGRVLMVALNRPKELNTMTDQMQADLERVLDWAEEEPSVWAIVVTGTLAPASTKAFCAGQDLKEWLAKKEHDQRRRLLDTPNGFGSISRRLSRKPLIAAVDGLCLGGGLELVLNCDLVIATQHSTFGFPEVSKGVFVAQGGIPRLLLLCGRTLASELLFLGRPVDAQTARDKFRIVNEVVPTTEALLPAVLRMAQQIIANSPAAVQLTKLAMVDTLRRGHRGFLDDAALGTLREEELGDGIELATAAAVLRDEFDEWARGPDMREGLRAFAEKRKPRWSDPVKITEKKKASKL
ncbi:hypothetical protein PTTG_02479 [Puccinia triticina 1-1 BBBD Race 1]|uniref:Enoyl-CoA hydratase n=2 Tax=Puccinia triticina TaxID=208348 RepID=A0A180H2C7_PUCT1|nr:uncharacterized protein PtA15_4A352 [Puccinia triticina]OAV98954.1 hypothetical protein PTTG_02479 [Puccinia triticina 1-1 BBBD Race 1]WAQ83903.1 hypothetical protein PtA15_4A352 [Puccinia triticina]WAR54751.1 hypothetical protein PtB15_4B368 [Puccinia triticina]